jgi:hypothetical protein
MRKLSCIIALSLAAFSASAAPPVTPSNDVFTPLAVSAFTPRTFAFPGTDGRTHLAYELLLTNTNVTPATIETVEIVDAANPSRILDTYDSKKLLAHLRTTGSSPADNATIDFNASRLLMINLDLDAKAEIPAKLLHRIKFLGATSPSHQPITPVSTTYTVAPIGIEKKLPHIGAPLAGKGWVALNGCCEVGVHRSSSISCNGGIYLAQRFAIDWMQLDDAGKMIRGDASDVRNYTDYGASILAVADGVVVGLENSLDDQKPGTLPDPSTINIGNVDGNHIVLDIGGGIYAFYAHLEKNSVTVKLGDHVKRAQVLAKLGNTGNTSAPHLHFHLMQSPSVLCSNGIPYVMDSFDEAGNIKYDYADETELSADFSKAFRPPNTRHDQYPLDLEIVNFGAPH